MSFSKNWLVSRIARSHVAQAVRYSRGRLLDVGCGDKPYRGLFGESVSSYVGLEIRVPPSRPHVVGDALVLPFLPCVFDTVLCTQVLEHLPEPGEAIVEMFRTLRPGGHLILTAPHIWGIHEEPRDYFRFTRFGLSHLLDRAGLEVVEVKAMAGYWVTAGARFCYYLEAFDKGILKPFVRISFCLVQLLVFCLDRVHRVEGDTWNYIAVGKKPHS